MGKALFSVAFLSFVLPACALITSNRDFAESACVNLARVRGYQIQQVESVRQERGPIWTVVLDVGRERVRCEYDAERANARLL